MIVLRAGVSKLRIDELAFAPDGTLLATPAGAAGVCLWDSFADQAKSDVLKLPVPTAKRLAFAPDGKALYAGSDRLCALDLATRTGTRIEIPAWAPLWFGVSPNSARLVVAENPRATQATRLTHWATEALDRPVRELTSPTLVYSPPLFAPSGGEFILMEGEWLPPRKWEYRRVTRSLQTGEVLDRSDPLPDCPDQAVLSPDGRTLACRLRESIWIYPAGGKWKSVPTIANDNKKHFTGIAYHPSGKYLAATSNDQTVKLYDAATQQVVRAFTWEIGRMRSVVFSPDGLRAAAGSDTGKVVVWDVDA